MYVSFRIAKLDHVLDLYVFFYIDNVIKCNCIGNFVNMWCCAINSMMI